MLYIEIPDGMRFDVLIQIGRKNGVDVEVKEDHFVPNDDSDKAPISIQAVVKKFLSSHKKSAVVDGLQCSKTKPMTSAPILVYRANNNGTGPSDKVIELNLTQKNAQTSTASNPATWWAQGGFLSEEKRAALDKKRDEQRANRRHYGDSPSAT